MKDIFTWYPSENIVSIEKTLVKNVEKASTLTYNRSHSEIKKKKNRQRLSQHSGFAVLRVIFEAFSTHLIMVFLVESKSFLSSYENNFHVT